MAYSPQEINNMAEQMFLALGQLSGAITVPELQVRLANALTQHPENDFMYAVTQILHDKLGKALKAAEIARM